MKPLVATRVVGVLAATFLALSGCAATSGPSAPGATSLTIRVDDGVGTLARSYTLTCEPAGGTHPEAAAACTALAVRLHPFAATPTGTACTDIYGGPQRATVEGTYRGSKVDATFGRGNGCEIARWDALVVVFRETGGAGGPSPTVR